MSVQRIACSPLTGRIYSGRLNRAQDAYIGEKLDVTSDVLRSVIEKAEYHGGAFEIEAGDQKWVVAVSKAPEAPAQAACIACGSGSGHTESCAAVRWGIKPAPEAPALASAVDERAAFEAWRGSFSWNRPFDPGEWAAWQARAALAKKGDAA